MKRILFLLYGITCYAVFLFTMVYAIGFAGNFMVAKPMDGYSQAPLAAALLINGSLLLLCTLLRRVLIASLLKGKWSRVIPMALGRSSFVLVNSFCLLVVMWFWQPVGGIVWAVDDKVGQAILKIGYLSGWCIVFISTFLLNHFDMFGLRQAWLYFTGRRYTPLQSQTPGFYSLVRHPFYIGSLLIAWSASVMTVTHLLLALAATAYIVAATQGEKNEWIVFREIYSRYKKWTPLWYLFLKRRRAK